MLFGLEIALHKIAENEDYEQFEGDVAADFKHAAFLFPKMVAEQIGSWKVESGYTFRGTWAVPREQKPHFSFDGTLHGDNISVGGLEFSSASANISYSPNNIQVSDLVVEDAAGHLEVEKLMVQIDEKEVRSGS